MGRGGNSYLLNIDALGLGQLLSAEVNCTVITTSWWSRKALSNNEVCGTRNFLATLIIEAEGQRRAFQKNNLVKSQPTFSPPFVLWTSFDLLSTKHPPIPLRLFYHYLSFFYSYVSLCHIPLSARRRSCEIQQWRHHFLPLRYRADWQQQSLETWQALLRLYSLLTRKLANLPFVINRANVSGYVESET